MFGLSPLKLYGSIALLLALIAAIAYGVHIKGKADKLDAVEAEYSQYQASVAARDKQAAEARAADESRRLALSATLTKAEKDLSELRNNPITRVVTREKIVNGVSCPDPSLGPDVARLWNDQADVATRAVSGAH